MNYQFEFKKDSRGSMPQTPKKYNNIPLKQENKNKQQDYSQINVRVNELTGQLDRLDEVIKSQREQIDSYNREEDQKRQYFHQSDSIIQQEVQSLHEIIQHKQNDLNLITLQYQELCEQMEDNKLLKENHNLQEQIYYLQEQFKMQVDALETKIYMIIKENDQLKQGVPTNTIKECLQSLQTPQLQHQNIQQWRSQNILLKDQLSYLLNEFQVLKDAYDESNLKQLEFSEEKYRYSEEINNLKSLLNVEMNQNIQLHNDNVQLGAQSQKLSTDLQQQILQFTMCQKTVDILKNQIIEQMSYMSLN